MEDKELVLKKCLTSLLIILFSFSCAVYFLPTPFKDADGNLYKNHNSRNGEIKYGQ